MKHLIKKLLREGLLLTENSLYNDKIISGVTKKIGDSSDDTLNKLAIAGLFKDSFGNIQQIKSKDQLDTLFKSWYDSTINKMIKTTAFIDNQDLAKKFLDAYVKNIKSLGDEARPFPTNKTMNDKIEKSLVNLVKKNKWIKDTSIKQSNDMYNPKDDDVVYEDDDIIILDTNTKAKCVRYGQGESWCISKAEENFYNTYRVKYRATPYFVLQKNVEGDEHKLVIMHYPDGYAIADRSNTGDRSGGNQDDNEPWEYIENEIPNLYDLEEYFPYQEISEDEKRYEDIIKWAKGYDDDNLQGYIDQEIKGLIINGSQVEAKDFIRDLYAEDIKISNENIKSLRPEVLDSLIESGYFLAKGEKQTNLLSTKQQLRVVRIKLQKYEPLTYGELSLLPEKERNAYISKGNDLGVTTLVTSSEEPEKVINMLLNHKDFISNLDLKMTRVDGIDMDISGMVRVTELLQLSKEPEKVANMLGDKFKEYVSNIVPTNLVSHLLTKSKIPERLYNLLGDVGKEFVTFLGKGGEEGQEIFERLLKKSEEPEKIMNILGVIGEELIDNLDKRTIIRIISFSKHPKKVMKIFGAGYI